MFKTTGVVDKKLLNEAKWHVLSKGKLIALAGFFVLMGIIALIGHLTDSKFCFGIGLMGVIVVPLETLWLTVMYVKTNLRQMQAATGKPYITYTTSFGADGVKVKDSNGTDGVLKYELITRISETPSAFLLFTPAGAFVPVFKAELPEREAFLRYIKKQPIGKNR